VHVARCVLSRRRTCRRALCKLTCKLLLTLVCAPQVTVLHTFVGVPGGYLWVRLSQLTARAPRASEGADCLVTGAVLGNLLLGPPSAALVYTGVLREQQWHSRRCV
jgi:hypothetical protein